MKGGILLL